MPRASRPSSRASGSGGHPRPAPYVPPSQPAVSTADNLSASIAAALQPVMDRLGRLEAATTPTPAQMSASAASPAARQPDFLGKNMFWSTISNSIVDKVVAGQFVEMAALLPPSPVTTSVPDFNIKLLPNAADGSLLLSQQQRTSRKIHDLGDWLEAWTNFMGIMSHSHPGRAAELIAYQDTILKASRNFEFNAVAVYDRVFRSRVAVDPTLRWDSVLQDLYTTTFNAKACRTFRPAEGIRNVSSSPAASGSTADDTCRLFNRGACRRRKCIMSTDAESATVRSMVPTPATNDLKLGRLQHLPLSTPVDV